MAKRPRYSRWRRLPEVFRTGEHKFPETSPETQRISLQLPVSVYETVEILVAKLEKPSLREYCTELLCQAIEGERLLHQVEEFQAKHGPLEGLAEIANDPDYLAEWKSQSAGLAGRGGSPDSPPESPAPHGSLEHYVSFHEDNPDETQTPRVEVEPLSDGRREEPEDAEESAAGLPASGSISWSVEPITSSIREIPMGNSLEETPTDIVHRHAGLGREDHWSFLPCLRRGEAPPASMVEELVEALAAQEEEMRQATTLDRRLAHALHRLALESQVLLTEAWPGAFDERTVLGIRAVQEAVERIFSGPELSPSSAEANPAAAESSR